MEREVCWRDTTRVSRDIETRVALSWQRFRVLEFIDAERLSVLASTYSRHLTLLNLEKDTSRLQVESLKFHNLTTACPSKRMKGRAGKPAGSLVGSLLYCTSSS
jgi:hypothetical protein